MAALAAGAVVSGCSVFTGATPGVRTPGAAFDDQIIEHLAAKEIRAADPDLANADLVVVSHNGIVLLAGCVPRAELKDQAQRAVERLAVRRVHNELTVAVNGSEIDHSVDSWLTGKIKTKMIGRPDVDANRINVTTVQRVVYLMGRVPRDQAEGAVAAAQGTRGVSKIVKVFEYVDEWPVTGP